ncbi:hypothetical protein ACO34A_03770 [Rhizobium sp. ACO-34A]|nr:class I SAM-dependent methyltransferase [Rhizobium sp. ACO-34A]ATN32918.1 hypothetical protein ACO34A_03770 [Rhizobium sp. ACO-34A]
MNNQSEKVREYWNAASRTHIDRGRWWQSSAIVSRINQRVAGIPSAGMHDGFNQLIERIADGRVYSRAISVGSGVASKEMALVRAGLVEHFDCYDLSDERVETGRKMWSDAGLADAVTFHCSDPFAGALNQSYDLVYWNNALHHMSDTERAVSLSSEMLVSGGVFAMDDFIGANRFQWSDRQIELANAFRSGLSPRHIGHHPTTVNRLSIEEMIAIDPSEAPDSENIVPALRTVFPGARIIPTGGVIYHLALTDVLEFIDEEEDASVLNTAMLLDAAISDLGENHYAVTVTEKR